MAKISNTTSYPFGTPTNDDYVIGTEAATLDTKNYKLGDIAGLDPTNTLSEVLTAGNEADAPLIGFGKSSLILKNAGVIQLQLNPQVAPGSPGAGDIIAAGDVTIGGFISLTGEFKDTNGSTGVAGEVLKSKGPGFGIEWKPDSQPPLGARKFWYGDPAATGTPLESTNILNDESGTGELYLGQVPNGITLLDNYFLARVKHPMGDDNLSYGVLALGTANAASINNTALGISSLQVLTTGSNNTAIGKSAIANANGDENTIVGSNAFSISGLASNGNTILGYTAANSSPDNTSFNTIVGHDAGFQASNTANVIVGNSSGRRATGRVVFIGSEVAPNSTWAGNVGIGYQALNNLGGGRAWTAIGERSAFTGTTGQRNVIIGSSSDVLAGGDSYCIAIGDAARTTDSSIAIGAAAAAPAPNSIALGKFSSAVNSNTININVSGGGGPVPTGGLITVAVGSPLPPPGVGPGDMYVVTNVILPGAVVPCNVMCIV